VLLCRLVPSHLPPTDAAGASAYVEMALIPSELDPKYARACLHLTAILGKEHLLPPPAPSPSVSPLLGAPSGAVESLATHPVDAGSAAAAAAALPVSAATAATATGAAVTAAAATAPVSVAASASAAPASRLAGVRVKRVDLLPRLRRDILVIDSDAATAAAFPHNTLLLPPHEEGGWDGILPAASAATATGAAAGLGGSKSSSSPPPRVPSAGAQDLSVNLHDDLQLAASLVSLYKTAAAQRILQERRQQQQQQQQALMQQAAAQHASLPQGSVQQGQGQGAGNGGAGAAGAPQASTAASDRVVQRAADIAAWLAYFRERAVREAAAGSTKPPLVGAAAAPPRHSDGADAPAGAKAPDAGRAFAAVSPDGLLASSRVVLRSVAEIELRHRAAAAARLAQSPPASVQKGDRASAKGAPAAPPLK